MPCNIAETMRPPSKTAASMACPACPRFFSTRQGLSHHCTVVHKNPLKSWPKTRGDGVLHRLSSCNAILQWTSQTVIALRWKESREGHTLDDCAPRLLYNSSASNPRPARKRSVVVDLVTLQTASFA